MTNPVRNRLQRRVRQRHHHAATLFTCILLAAGCSDPDAGDIPTSTGAESIPAPAIDDSVRDAAAVNDPSPGTAGAPVDGEQLLAEPPVGWHELYSTQRPAFRLVDYVPEGSPVEWVEKVSFEAVAGPDTPDLIDFAASIAKDQAEICERFEHHNTFTGFENGYETTVRLYACTNNPGLERGQVMMLKAITGDEFFYTIIWAKRVTPFTADDALPVDEAEIGRWSTYLRRIKLCNTKSTDHPCHQESSKLSTEESAVERSQTNESNPGEGHQDGATDDDQGPSDDGTETPSVEASQAH